MLPDAFADLSSDSWDEEGHWLVLDVGVEEKSPTAFWLHSDISHYICNASP